MSSRQPEAPKPVESLSYEEAFQELRAVVQSIEGGQLPLDQSVQAFQRGTELLKRCQSVLDTAELRVRELTTAQLAGGQD